MSKFTQTATPPTIRMSPADPKQPRKFGVTAVPPVTRVVDPPVPPVKKKSVGNAAAAGDDSAPAQTPAA